jgi:hypothetical protein
VEGAKEATGWDLKVADELETTDPPTDEELKVWRDLKARIVVSRGEVTEGGPARNRKECLKVWFTEEQLRPGSSARSAPL